MGQKVDARIFRLGICKKTWEQKYIEKKNEDSSLYLYKTLEIRKYLFRIFELYKIKVHNCKILYSDNSIQIFISFYVTEKTIYIIDKNLIKYQKKISTRLLRRTKKSIKKYRSKKKQKYIKRHKSKKKHISKNKQKCKKKRIYISKYISKIKNKKIKKYKKNKKNILRYYSKILCIRKKNKKNLFHFFLDKKQTILLKKFEDVLLGSLSLYTKEKTNIFIKLQNLNKYKQLSSSQIKDCKNF